MRVYRKARDKYSLDDSFFNERGSLIFTNLHDARVFTQKINEKRDLINFPEMAAKASEINGMTLEIEIIHHLIDLYEEENNINVAEGLIEWLEEKIGAKKLEKTLRVIIEDYPPPSVYNNEIDIKEYLNGKTKEGTPNKNVSLSTLIPLWLCNINPAFSSHLELFDDANLEKKIEYFTIIDQIRNFFDTQPSFGPENLNFLEMAQSFLLNSPHSIKGQLEYIIEKWQSYIEPFQYRLLLALDFINEEEKLRFLGPGKAQVYEYDFLDENYTPDRDWMPNVVMIAKNVYVWLDQLSKKYKKKITQLDSIPNEELDQLVGWGFNSLWLIGLWERSQASKTIKQWCGNPEADASAYSLYDYVIAQDLGGNEALNMLKAQALERGIRIASDMVPNHTGIDSKWMREHPDWYISLPFCPFPAYSYSGQSLSNDPRIGIFVEDHYFSRTDAAVTFKWTNYETNEVKYMYHGNDGTSMPWNDTAQLNFLIPEVRESVIQTILHVARMFPIIRFDAAMTLTKKHYHRLWFPAPGSGGDIPSRAEHGLSKQDFDKAMPREFWREVVERINQEAPDTLLLAEAFWLLEGFFVRALGMHRVYNSAFMNMLRDENNANYRSVIKNTIEYDPEILKRFVNFMNNPDEETSANQFGKGDKYFGICLLLVTMPGLPMFGHGQIEGFAEKYGMEYRRAYWDESADNGFIQYHEQFIFPLMKKRSLFSEVRNFLLYDFFTAEGFVNEDVFAYSNASGTEKSLVVFHNKFANTKGWIKTSAAFMETIDQNKQLIQRTLGEGLSLHHDQNFYCVFRDQVKNLEYIRQSKELIDNGLYIELTAYQSIVLLNFREIQDNENKGLALLHDFLGGKGVTNIDQALQELLYQSIHKTFKELVNITDFKALISASDREIQENNDAMLENIHQNVISLLKEVNIHSKDKLNESEITEEIIQKLLSILSIKKAVTSSHYLEKYPNQFNFLNKNLPSDPNQWGIVLSWIFIHLLGKSSSLAEYELQSRSRIEEWGLGRIIGWTFQELSKEYQNSWEDVILVKILTSHQNWDVHLVESEYQAARIMRNFFSDLEVQAYIQVNRFQNTLWFNQEAFEDLVKWLFIISVINIISSTSTPYIITDKTIDKIHQRYRIIQSWKKAGVKSLYQVEKYFDELQRTSLNNI
ncbi:MAG: alpha-amylase family glycosyl hydrolase [Candidatus Hodarchaeales archaeon]|jgi:glycosidase